MTMFTGTLSTATLGWSVWKMISSSMRPGDVPGGTVTVSRYRPLRVGVSLGTTDTSIFSGLCTNLKLVGRPSRTSNVMKPDALFAVDCDHPQDGGHQAYRTGRYAGEHKLVLGLVRMIGLDDQLFTECPQGHAGLELELDLIAAFQFEFLELLGVRGVGLATMRSGLEVVTFLIFNSGCSGEKKASITSWTRRWKRRRP